MYVSLAVRFGWTPDQVNAMPMDFLEELICRVNAQDKIEKEELDKLKNK